MTNERIATQKPRYQNFLSTLLRNWHFMRWLRLGIGLFLSWQMVRHPDIFTGLIAGVFLFQAITNTGCCAASGCAAPETGSKAATNADEEPVYEEIKQGNHGRQKNI